MNSFIDFFSFPVLGGKTVCMQGQVSAKAGGVSVPLESVLQLL